MIYWEPGWHWIRVCDGSMDLDCYGFIQFYGVKIDLELRSEIALPQLIQLEIDG